MSGESCPICNAAVESRAAGEAEEDSKKLDPVRRVAVWMIDRNEPEPNPAVFMMSWSMDRDIAALCHNRRTGKVLLIDHPSQGYDVQFNRTGKGLGTRYIGIQIERDVSAIDDDESEQDRILEFISETAIPDVLNYYDYDHLQKMIEGSAEERDSDLDDDDDADDDDRKPKKKKGKKKSKAH